MKRVKFLIAIFVAAVAMASCTTTQRISDDDFDEATTRRIGNRVYVDDPYYGTVILERDPYSGRYYDVTNGYGRFGYSNPYNTWNTRGYRTYRPSYRSGNSGYSHPQTRPSQDVQKTREEARKKILGN